MIKKVAKLLLVVFSLIITAGNNAHAEKVYDFNATCQAAYNQITSLKLQAGQLLINQARLENPDNLIPDFLESYIDFFILFFNEDPAEYETRKPHFEQRLTLLSEGPEDSPFNKYCRSLVTLQKAAVAIKFGERWSVAWDFRKGFNLIKENRKQFPDFTPNNMIYGPLEVGVGTIPGGYKWLAGLFGIKGNIKNGMQLMRNFLSSNDQWAKLFSTEATFYYSYLLFYIENKPDEVVNYFSQKKLDVVNNHLYAYVASNLGLNNKKTDYARNIILNRNPSSEYMQTPVWDFELGYAYLHHMELDNAIKHFDAFLQQFKGKFYVKDSYQKLSWCYYLKGNTTAAENARQQILKKGGTDTDADKKALKDAKNNVWPNQLLLKARMLSDGGYNKEALGMLQGKSSNDFPKTEDKLEFAYRLARIYDDLGKDANAIQAYLSAIKLGENRTEYYAARAALQIGYIYERQGNKAMAQVYYQKCLDMEDHEYKDSLDQRAKAGIARCKGQ